MRRCGKIKITRKALPGYGYFKKRGYGRIGCEVLDYGLIGYVKDREMPSGNIKY